MRRHLTTWALLALLAALALPVAAGAVAPAAPITVTTTADEVTENAVCSLREAVIAANTDQAVGGCPAGSGADTIVFDAGLPVPATFSLSLDGPGENASLAGDLDLAGDVTITGVGSGNTILDGNNSDRIFEILPAARVTLSGFTLQHGNPGAAAGGGGLLVDVTGALTMTGSLLTANSAASGGGALVLGRLTLAGSIVSHNQGDGITNNGGATTLTGVNLLDNAPGFGVRNLNQGALSHAGGLVLRNAAGGVHNATARATLSGLTIQANLGPGVTNTGASYTPLALSASTISGNHATSGGGLANAGIGATATIVTTSFIGNQATAAGGGLFNSGIMTLERSLIADNSARSGGGIDQSGYLHLTNDTLSGNTASDNGGGLYSRGSAVLSFVSFVDNQSGGPATGAAIFNDGASLSIGSSIISSAGGANNCFNSEGFINSAGHNLENGDTCGLNGAGDIVNTQSLLGPLADNDGPTATHALLPGSLAIDHGGATGCPATDQRGTLRPQGNACDSGAFEAADTLTQVSPRFLPLMFH